MTSAAILLALANAAPAFAQTKGTGQEPCTQAGDSSKSLSEKLDQGSGVICPPNVDPAIKAPTPQTGQTPVIPPPGSPGGDPKVQPKYKDVSPPQGEGEAAQITYCRSGG